ncbi:hypothetical protein CY652_00260 [Burkholderia sp. WAC0059]|uniref:FUSC family protein n=1 Tax=Burkholderia sp. WAC0059 TaxID=2066022 RepID=UPI000C7EECD0|nr:FUSC family protein [Burkholderia sp. WAC0059]PLZ04157.1 hypothetical protein CY652_00260 [Burkholderia sp. WAC0059]
MNDSPDNLLAHLTTLQQSVFNVFKRLPLKSRALQGLLMALRAVCAASLAYGLGELLHTGQAFWAAITAIAVTQHNYADTLNLSRDQFIGALAGGVCGFAGAVLGGGYYEAYVATIAIVITGCWCLNVGSAARLGAITATIVLLVPAAGPAWSVALVRFAEVTIGMVCALPVSWLFSYAERRWLHN